ncbi:MAG: sulfatase [Pseudomonadota bacterium]
MRNPKFSLYSTLALSSASLLVGCTEVMSNDQSIPDIVDDRPNIIFILADDHRYDAFGHFNPVLETPNLDQMIEKGTHFENAFVTTSLCSPSRASIQYSLPMRDHGVVDNNSATPKTLKPFATYLQQDGYETAFIGKWHMGNDDASPKPGYDHWVSFEGQGNYGPVDAFGRESLFNVNGETEPQGGYITDVLTDRAINWIDKQTNAPFFLFLSHKAAHLPFTPAERHADSYSDVEFSLPESADITTRSGPSPMWLTMQRNSWHGIDFPYYSARDLNDFRQDYHRSIQAVDDSLGRLFETVSRSDRETIFLYTSDNGFMFGEQGLIDKRAAYEASIRVPMILYSPQNETADINSSLVRNIDVAPTLLSLASITPPDYFAGRDMRSASDDTPLIYEYFWEFNYPQTPTTFALRDDRYKYIQYHGVWDVEELYDLQEDPEETRNLINDPAHSERVIAMRAALYDELTDGQSDQIPAIPFTARFNQGAVFWTPDGPDSVSFPPEWMRDANAADKYEHILPDGPTKAQQLQAITPAIQRAIDNTTEESAP